MGQVVIRNIDDLVLERLKARAAEQHKSLEQSLRDLLTQAAKPSRAAKTKTEPAAKAARMSSACGNPDISVTLVSGTVNVKVRFKSSLEHGYAWNAHWRSSAADRPAPLDHSLL